MLSCMKIALAGLFAAACHRSDRAAAIAKVKRPLLKI
jgi:hypothetical protein